MSNGSVVAVSVDNDDDGIIPYITKEFKKNHTIYWEHFISLAVCRFYPVVSGKAEYRMQPIHRLCMTSVYGFVNYTKYDELLSPLLVSVLLSPILPFPFLSFSFSLSFSSRRCQCRIVTLSSPCKWIKTINFNTKTELWIKHKTILFTEQI